MRDSKGRFCKVGFKVGDVVSGVDIWDRALTHMPVEFIDTEEPCVKVDGRWCFSQKVYIDPAPSPKFGVGDTVTIKGENGRWVVDVCESMRYRCVRESMDDCFWAKPEDMKKVLCPGKLYTYAEVGTDNPTVIDKPEVSQDPIKIEVVAPETQIGDVSLGSPVDGDIVITPKGGRVVNGYSFTDGGTASCADTLRIKGLDYGITCKPAIVPGSVVRLRSGGPDMTVQAVNVAGMDGIVGLAYFHAGKKLDAMSPLVCLEFVR